MKEGDNMEISEKKETFLKKSEEITKRYQPFLQDPANDPHGSYRGQWMYEEIASLAKFMGFELKGISIESGVINISVS